jgi:hypothetical protein
MFFERDEKATAKATLLNGKTGIKSRPANN